jgi:hypothetical protein
MHPARPRHRPDSRDARVDRRSREVPGDRIEVDIDPDFAGREIADEDIQFGILLLTINSSRRMKRPPTNDLGAPGWPPRGVPWYARRMPDYKKRFREGEYYEHVIVEDTQAAAKVGTIRIKPVSVLWKPKSAQKYYSVSIEAFDAWIREHGTPVTK